MKIPMNLKLHLIATCFYLLMLAISMYRNKDKGEDHLIVIGIITVAFGVLTGIAMFLNN